MIKRFFLKIYCWLMDTIILPIIRWWNYHINRQYLPDNIRTEALFNYMSKIIDDPTYEPQGAYENAFEQQMLESHRQVQALISAGKLENMKIPNDTIIDYYEHRAYYAREIYRQMLMKAVVKED